MRGEMRDVGQPESRSNLRLDKRRRPSNTIFDTPIIFQHSFLTSQCHERDKQMQKAPRKHHYVPQFYLRNFASDAEKQKIATVSKNGEYAVWATRSIETLGYERDLYVHLHSGAPISVETILNQKVEIPISRSDTWKKISSGRTDLLDISDKPILYALIRHLEVRTPHFLETGKNITRIATNSNNSEQFTDEERKHYSFLAAFPEKAKQMFNLMSSTLDWTEHEFRNATLAIYRSPIPLRSSTTPVFPIRAPAHPAIHLPLPGQIPFQRMFVLNKYTFASLVIGSFDDEFINEAISVDIAKGLNRHFVGQFSHFEHVRHLITQRNDLIIDMTWAPYDLIDEKPEKITFRRRSK